MALSSFSIDKQSKKPIYQQIVDQVIYLIQQGVLKSGDMLPTSQDFFDVYGIARGTVTHAYSLLRKEGIITTTQGKGSFIAKIDINGSSDIIERYLDELLALNFSLEKIEAIVSRKLKAQSELSNTLRAAVIETCPELLSCAVDSLSQFKSLQISGLLINDLLSIMTLPLGEYDLILMSSSNANIAMDMDLDDAVKARIIPFSFSFTPETLKGFSRISFGESVGLLCQTKRYAGMIKWELAVLDALFTPSEIFLFSSDSGEDFQRFCQSKQHLLVPNHFEQYCTPQQLAALSRLAQGKTPPLQIEYTLDCGSSLYLEDTIRNYQLLHHYSKQGGAS